MASADLSLLPYVQYVTQHLHGNSTPPLFETGALANVQKYQLLQAVWLILSVLHTSTKFATISTPKEGLGTSANTSTSP